MASPTTGDDADTDPQWQFLLITDRAAIRADPQEVIEEEIFVDRTVEVPVRGIRSRKRSPSVSESATEVENVRVKVRRWKGTFGGCPKEGKWS